MGSNTETEPLDAKPRKFRIEPEPRLPVTPTPDPRVAWNDPKDGYWVPGCCGSETAFWTRTGRHLLYCWNPVTGVHAYLDLQTDWILTDDEARLALGTF